MPDSGPEAGLDSAIEGLKGAGKELAGTVVGNTDLKEEGQAQQEKAGAERDVAEQEAKAEASRGKAEALDAEERSHQS